MQRFLWMLACCCIAFSSVTQPNIVQVEYFFNSDPGFGNATSIPVAPAVELDSVKVNLPIDALDEGLNTLFLRSRDANGKWSVTSRWIFAKVAGPAPLITAIEYFIDNDPGFGNANSLPVSPGTDIADYIANINISGLDDGLHILFIRSKDASGKWSVTSRWIFVKVPAAPPLITNIEYFIDPDPGFGNAVPIAINASTDIPDYISPVNITGLDIGSHMLFLRSKDVNGKWSVTSRFNFFILNTEPTPAIYINGITKKVMCGDENFNLSFHATGNYNNGNTFNLELSDATGSFSSPTIIGSVNTTASSIINAKVPLHIPNGNNYRVRVVSSNTVFTGATSDTIFTLYDQPRFPDTTAFIVCQDETINLTSLFNTTGFTTVWNTATATAVPPGSYQLISSNTPMCMDTTQVDVLQEIAVWTGSTSSNWHAASNWSTHKVPSEKAHVIIVPGTPNICELSVSDVTISSLQVRNAAVFNVINNRQVIVSANCDPLPTF